MKVFIFGVIFIKIRNVYLFSNVINIFVLGEMYQMLYFIYTLMRCKSIYNGVSHLFIKKMKFPILDAWMLKCTHYSF